MPSTVTTKVTSTNVRAGDRPTREIYPELIVAPATVLGAFVIGVTVFLVARAIHARATPRREVSVRIGTGPHVYSYNSE